MIPFLVKLANLLDDRGQHGIAREVDDLIEKLVRVASPEPATLAEGEPMNVPGKVMPMEISALYNKLLGVYQMLQRQVQGDTGVGNQEAANSAWQDFSYVAQKIDSMGVQVPPGPWGQAKETMKRQTENILQNGNDPAKANEVAQMFGAEADVLKWLLTSMHAPKAEQPVAGKKQPPKRRPNAMILGIQKALGAKATGFWNPELNNLFAQHMQQRHPDKMSGGKFQGNLKDAYELLMSDQQAPVASNEPGKLPKEDDEPGKLPKE